MADQTQAGGTQRLVTFARERFSRPIIKIRQAMEFLRLRPKAESLTSAYFGILGIKKPFDELPPSTLEKLDMIFPGFRRERGLSECERLLGLLARNMLDVRVARRLLAEGDDFLAKLEYGRRIYPIGRSGDAYLSWQGYYLDYGFGMDITYPRSWNLESKAVLERIARDDYPVVGIKEMHRKGYMNAEMERLFALVRDDDAFSFIGARIDGLMVQFETVLENFKADLERKRALSA